MGSQEMTPGAEPLDCVIYARYSSHNQREVSIEQQVKECEDYARYNGLRVVKVYADRALTGNSRKCSRMPSGADGPMSFAGRWTGLPVTVTIPPPTSTGSSVTGSG